jgi:aminopeptidase N
MENITATTLTTMTLDDALGNKDDQSHGLVAHEAAHQWFGNLMTCADWSHIWLNESLATYMTLLYYERTRGVDEFRVRMRDAQESYLRAEEEASRPIVFGVYKDPMDLFGGHVYPGGASRLHLLRSILGDDVFVDGIRRYVADNKGRAVKTFDLRSAFEDAAGEGLEWFFDQWLYAPGFPEFETSWQWDDERGILEYTVVQTQLGEVPRAFRAPVDIEIRDSGGRSTHRVWIDERREVFEFPIVHEPIWVRFDKYGFVPKRVRAKRTHGEWIAIAKEDEDVNGRRDALKKLGWMAAETPDPDVQELFRGEIVDRLAKEELPQVRAVAAAAAGRAGGLEARAQLVETAAGDPDAGVREAALDALCSFGPDPELASFAREQFETRYSWDVMGAAGGLVASADPDEAYAWLTAKLLFDSPHDQLRADLLRHLAKLENPGVLDQLKEWVADESSHPSARAVAVEELGRRARGRASVAAYLADFLEVEDFRMRSAVLRALGGFEDPRTKRRLLDHYRETVFPREKRIIEASLGTGN